jgi:hypothetical protein
MSHLSPYLSVLVESFEAGALNPAESTPESAILHSHTAHPDTVRGILQCQLILLTLKKFNALKYCGGGG